MACIVCARPYVLYSCIYMYIYRVNADASCSKKYIRSASTITWSHIYTNNLNFKCCAHSNYIICLIPQKGLTLHVASTTNDNSNIILNKLVKHATSLTPPPRRSIRTRRNVAPTNQHHVCFVLQQTKTTTLFHMHRNVAASAHKQPIYSCFPYQKSHTNAVHRKEKHGTEYEWVEYI